MNQGNNSSSGNGWYALKSKEAKAQRDSFSLLAWVLMSLGLVIVVLGSVCVCFDVGVNVGAMVFPDIEADSKLGVAITKYTGRAGIIIITMGMQIFMGAALFKIGRLCGQAKEHEKFTESLSAEVIRKFGPIIAELDGLPVSLKQRLDPRIEELGELAGKVSKKLAPKISQIDELVAKLSVAVAANRLGLRNCHDDRTAAFTQFFDYAAKYISKDSKDPNRMIKIVSNTAAGMLHDFGPIPSQNWQKEWRDFIIAKPTHFQIVLVHPAYAPLREPAEYGIGFPHGYIANEVLHTSMFLLLQAGMSNDESKDEMSRSGFKFFRGSPTVFYMQIGERYLLNPHPYGKVEGLSLGLEFLGELPLIRDFGEKHFDHTWNMVPAPPIGGKPLVQRISTFNDILDAFTESVKLVDPNDPEKGYMMAAFVDKLDSFFHLMKGKCTHEKLIEELKKYDDKATPFKNIFRNITGEK